MDRADEGLAAKLQALLPHLDERQRRLLLGAEARALGHGGIRRVARAAGVAEGTVSRGVAELEAGEAPLGRTRREGGGRKRLVDLDPGLRLALLALVEPDVRGDPMSPLRWTTKSTRKLADEVRAQGWPISADTVAGLLPAETRLSAWMPKRRNWSARTRTTAGSGARRVNLSRSTRTTSSTGRPARRSRTASTT